MAAARLHAAVKGKFGSGSMVHGGEDRIAREIFAVLEKDGKQSRRDTVCSDDS